MENIFITTISTLLFFALFIQPSIAQDHAGNHHKSEEMERFKDVPEEFRTNLTDVVKAYISGKVDYFTPSRNQIFYTQTIHDSNTKLLKEH